MIAHMFTLHDTMRQNRVAMNYDDAQKRAIRPCNIQFQHAMHHIHVSRDIRQIAHIRHLSRIRHSSTIDDCAHMRIRMLHS
jgi:hypothetical protein